MIYYMTEMFGNVVDTGSIYIICNALFERKPGTKKLYILIVIILQSVAMMLLNTLVGSSHWVVLLALIITSYLFCGFFYYVDGFKYVIAIISFFVMVAVLEVLVIMQITSFFKIENILHQQNVYRILGILTTKILTLYILVLISRMFKMKEFKLEKYSMLTLLMMGLSLTVFFMATGIYIDSPQLGFHVTYIMTIAAIMAMISILMLVVVRRIIEAIEEKTRFMAVENEYRNQIEYLKKHEELADEIKERRHDHKNHLVYISSLVENKKDAAISDYVKGLLEVESKMDDILGIRNKLMSALINYNRGRMDNEKIDFDCYVDLPTELHVSDVDMTIIMGNLLDNAIEACLGVDDKRYIDLDIDYGYGRINIVMKNSFNGKAKIVDNHVQTSKEDKDFHGYGLRNIKKAAEKYDGSFTISGDNKEFIAKIVI